MFFLLICMYLYICVSGTRADGTLAASEVGYGGGVEERRHGDHARLGVDHHRRDARDEQVEGRGGDDRVRDARALELAVVEAGRREGPRGGEERGAGGAAGPAARELLEREEHLRGSGCFG